MEKTNGKRQKMASERKIKIFDTTLRDGEQSPGASMNLTEKLEVAQALIDLANAQLEQARLALTIAEKDLADSLVFAPINGWISERFCEPGEMAAPGTPVLRIEDLSVLEVSVFLQSLGTGMPEIGQGLAALLIQ